MVKKFLTDMYNNRCIRCTGCEVACKQQNGTPTGVRRIRVITFNKGEEGKETNMPMPCLHCTTPPCMYVCPVKAIYKREDGVVLLHKDVCIGCGYCLFACPFGAPQFEEKSFGRRAKMDKCTFCVEPYEQNDLQGKRIVRDVKPRCALFCSTEHLLGGEADEIAEKLRDRVGEKMVTGTTRVFLTF